MMHDINGHEIKKGDVLKPVSGCLETIRIIKISDNGEFAWFQGLEDTITMNNGVITQFAIDATRRAIVCDALPDPQKPARAHTGCPEVDNFIKSMMEVD